MTKRLNDATPEEWDSLRKGGHIDLNEESIDNAIKTISSMCSDRDVVRRAKPSSTMKIDITDEELEAIIGSKDAKIKARKNDAGKLPMDLIPPEAERMEAEVLAHGLKYGPHNWRGGLQYSRLIAALMRHFSAWRMGEDLDPESGLSHMAHVRAISGFLCTFIAEDRIDLDNRYRKEVK